MNYYEILKISETASQEVIYMAYKALCKKYNPDVYDGDMKIAEEKLKQINAAFEILFDEQKRKQYDNWLKNKKDSFQTKSNEQCNALATNKKRVKREFKYLSDIKSELIISILLTTIIGGSLLLNNLLGNDSSLNQSLNNNVTLIVAVEDSFEPFSYKENNEYYGIHIDIAKEMANRFNCDVEFVSANFDELIDGVDKGRYDIAFGVEKTPEREEYVMFTEPYHEEMCVIFSGESFNEYINIKLTLKNMIKDGTVNNIISKYEVLINE